MQELSDIKTIVQQWNKLNKELSELGTTLQLVEEEPDASLEKEFIDGIIKLKSEIDSLELESTLSQSLDKSNAIVSIHAGAGGTEACDWAGMLMRMYMRWAEKKRFEVQVVDMLPGEEAGIKSVTFMVKGQYAYGLLRGELSPQARENFTV